MFAFLHKNNNVMIYQFFTSLKMTKGAIFIFIFGCYSIAYTQLPNRKVQNKAFSVGEKIEFRVHYGMFTAGTASFEVKPLVNHKGKTCYRFFGLGKSATAFDWFFKVNDYLDSYVEINSFVPLKYRRKVDEGNFHYEDDVVYDYENQKISGKQGLFNIVEGVQDMLSGLYYARCLDVTNMEPGTVIKIPTFLDDKIYDLGLKIIGKETIKTSLGTFKCIKITPVIVSGRVFKGNDEMKIWVTDDANYLPIRVESPIIVGTVKADIKSIKNARNIQSSKIK